MKKIFFALLLSVVTLTSCGSAPSKDTEASTKTASIENGVEILYFHGKQRCISCRAIEDLSSQVAQNDFSQQMKDGEVVYRIIDISTEEGKEIAKKYKVSFSSLFANKWVDGKETINDLTKMGFSFAKNQPEKFKSEFKAKLTELLK